MHDANAQNDVLSLCVCCNDLPLKSGKKKGMCLNCKAAPLS